VTSTRPETPSETATGFQAAGIAETVDSGVTVCLSGRDAPGGPWSRPWYGSALPVRTQPSPV
jgi:hypothetical protein